MATEDYVHGYGESEMERLRGQHDGLKAVMRSLVLAPLLLNSPGLKILDSGTADGCWLIDLLMSASVHPSARLVGTDVSSAAFPKSRPQQVDLFEQSIMEPWPMAWKGTFDLVHQRATMPAIKASECFNAIQALVELVKPHTGWIQLVEPDMSGYMTPEEALHYPALKRFTELFAVLMPALGHDPQPGPKLKGWLYEAGVTNIQEKIIDLPIGKQARDPILGEAAKRNLLAVVRGFEATTENVPRLGVTSNELSDLYRALASELDEIGGFTRWYVVYGQRNEHSEEAL